MTFKDVWRNEVFDKGNVVLVTDTDNINYAIGVFAEHLLSKNKSLDKELTPVLMHYERFVKNGHVYFVHPEEVARYMHE